MDERKIIAARRQIAIYREYLAKGVGGGYALVCVCEIMKLELLLEKADQEGQPHNPRD